MKRPELERKKERKKERKINNFLPLSIEPVIVHPIA
jgi:hypothetical protein